MHRRYPPIGAVALGLAMGRQTAPRFTTRDEAMVRGMFDNTGMWVREGCVAA